MKLLKSAQFINKKIIMKYLAIKILHEIFYNFHFEN